MTCVQEGVVELCCENDLAEAEREDPSVMPMRRFFQKCANNLATAGAEPVAAELVIFLPESVEEPELKALMSEAEGIAADEVIGFELDHGRCDHIQEGFDSCSLPALRRCFLHFLCQMNPSFIRQQ